MKPTIYPTYVLKAKALHNAPAMAVVNSGKEDEIAAIAMTLKKSLLLFMSAFSDNIINIKFKNRIAEVIDNENNKSLIISKSINISLSNMNMFSTVISHATDIRKIVSHVGYVNLFKSSFIILMFLLSQR